ncbi:SgcJ/EcaC family oxidoreductase [Micromonospora chersina]|uniref:SgcJ/EcaC family oxidoreductase n=1 Tax=Micromonospora chersina TaxID=47854 RepID=UPI0033BFDE92
MTTDAASLVAGAKQWASYYGDYPNGEEGAVLTAPLRIRAAWGDNDADAFAGLFIENGSLLIGDTQLNGREEIRAYMAKAFAGGWKGTRLTEQPRDIRLIADEVAVAITEGGIVRPGEDGLDPLNEERAMWVLVKRDGDWRVAARQTSPIRS